jgi:hypothetical protein
MMVYIDFDTPTVEDVQALLLLQEPQIDKLHAHLFRGGQKNQKIELDRRTKLNKKKNQNEQLQFGSV